MDPRFCHPSIRLRLRRLSIRSDPTVRSDCIGASDFYPTLNFLPPAVALRLKLVARAFRLSKSALPRCRQRSWR
jgi:hypothetical protein